MFTKKDLRTGMTVTLRGDAIDIDSDTRYQVLIGTQVGDAIVRDNGFLYLSKYNEDLTYNCSSTSAKGIFDITNVYEPTKMYQLEHDKFDCQTMVYNRISVREITMRDIADKFGLEVENIKIKE